MALILNIETSTDVCSVSLSRDEKIIAFREDDKYKSHASKLTVFIEEVIKEANSSMKDIDAISVSEGPGSYTGLRIGVSVAKGLCYALETPLIAVSPLKAMAWGCIQQTESPQDYWFSPLMDARRMEVYTAVYDSQLTTIQEVESRVIDETSFQDLLQQKKLIFFGNGADKCKEIISSASATFYDNIRCSSIYMAALAAKKYRNTDFKNVAYFEPYYLKDFIATKPRRKII